MSKTKAEIKNPTEKLVKELLEEGMYNRYAGRPGHYIQFLTQEDFTTAVNQLRTSGFQEFNKGEMTGDFRIAGDSYTIEIQGRIRVEQRQVHIAPRSEIEEKTMEPPPHPPEENEDPLVDRLKKGLPIKYGNRPGIYVKFPTKNDLTAAVAELRNAGFDEFEKGDMTGDFRIAGDGKSIEIQGRLRVKKGQVVIDPPAYIDSMQFLMS